MTTRELKIDNARMQRGRAYLSLISEFEPSQSDYRLFLRHLLHYYDTFTSTWKKGNQAL